MKSKKIIYTTICIVIFLMYLLKVANYSEGYLDIWIHGAILVVVLVIGGILYLKKETTNKFKIGILLILIALFVSYPLYNDYLVYSHDINFNLVRIEGLKEAIGNFQIPARIHPIENNGYGYATSLLYPELFLYVPAILRLLNTSMVFSFKIFLVLINLAAVVSMYLCVKNISKSTTSGIIGAIIYAVANYRLENVFTRAAVGEALALAFLPIAIWGLYELLVGNKKKWYICVIGITFVIQSHVLSSILTAILCGILGVYFIKNIIKEKRYKEILLTVVVTLLLNMWFIVPFLDAYRLNLNVKNIETKTYQFEKYTVIPAQIFNIFDTGYSLNITKENEKGMENEMAYSLGILCMVGFAISITYCIKNKESKEKLNQFIRILTIIAIVFLIGSTTIVPWKELQNNFEWIRCLCMMLQFGWRFLGIATVAVTITTSIIIGQYLDKKYDSEKDFIENNKIVLIIGIIAFLSVPLFLGEYSKQPKYITNDYALNYDMSGQCEYFIQGTNTKELTKDLYQTSSKYITITDISKNGSKIVFNYSNIEGQGYIEVPLLYYPGYVAKDENGKKFGVTCGNNNVIRIEITEIKEGTITVDYQEKGIYILADIISVVTLCGLIYGIKRSKKVKQK